MLDWVKHPPHTNELDENLYIKHLIPGRGSICRQGFTGHTTMHPSFRINDLQLNLTISTGRLEADANINAPAPETNEALSRCESSRRGRNGGRAGALATVLFLPVLLLSVNAPKVVCGQAKGLQETAHQRA